MIALAVFALLGRIRRWWGTLAVVKLCLPTTSFVIGARGEVFVPATPHVSHVLLVASGAMYDLLALSLLLSGIAELVDRVRADDIPRARARVKPLRERVGYRSLRRYKTRFAGHLISLQMGLLCEAVTGANERRLGRGS